MSKNIHWRLLLGCVICFVTASAVKAEVNASDDWKSWLISQIESHPEIQAAKSQMESAIANANSWNQPLYNPELETEYEREGNANNYRVGVSQTVDWWNKRGTRSDQTETVHATARLDYELRLQDKVAEALQALAQWDAAKARYELARRQETSLDTLIKLVKDRQNAGDVGQLDVDLTLLSLSQKLNETAQAFSAYKTSEAKVRELLPEWSENKKIDLKSVFTFETSNSAQEFLDIHPFILSAKAVWKAKKQQAKLTRLETKAEPTFGLNAGRSAEDNVVGLSFSMPLNIRKNYSAQIEASDHEVIAAEAQYRAAIRQQRFAIENASMMLDQYKQQSQRWQSLMQGSNQKTQTLIEKQWQIGELSTNDYLLALQQIMQGSNAGIDLHEQYQLAAIHWLQTTGQITSILTGSAE